MESLLYYSIILLVIFNIIAIVYFVNYYNSLKFCENNENTNCPVYTCPAVGTVNAGLPAYRIDNSGSYQCSSITGVNPICCQPGISDRTQCTGQPT